MSSQRQQYYERYICRYIHGSPDLLLDVGVGPKTEWRVLQHQYPQMDMLGLEPHPVTFAQLWAGFPGTLYPLAAWDEEATLTLHHNPQNVGASSVNRSFQMPGATSYQVTAQPLDAIYARFCQEQGRQYRRILLWMDVEGAETRVLRGAQQLLASGAVRWANLEELRPGVPVPAGWADPRENTRLLAAAGLDRLREYNVHAKHHDVIYRHREEP